MDKKRVLEIANSISKNTLMETLEIYYTDVGDDFLRFFCQQFYSPM